MNSSDIAASLREIGFRDPAVSFGTWARTLANLAPAQVIWNARRRLVPSRPVKPVDPASAPKFRQLDVSAFVTPDPSHLGQSQFRFLNQTVEFGGAIDWRAPGQSRLWHYNLHYFEYLLQTSQTADEARRLITAWIKACPQGTPAAWEPYPVSLRIVNWVKFALSQKTSPEPEVVASLLTQGRWLERNLEFHLRGNHLLKNAKALIYVGAVLEGAEAARLFERGTELLTQILKDQFLADGGYYERSAMYHALATEDLFDLLNLLRSRGCEVDIIRELTGAAVSALGVLGRLTLPCGELCLLGDSANAIAPTCEALREYGARLDLPAAPAPGGAVDVFALPDFGVQGYRTAEECLILDCGQAGPKEQPGHDHCGLLSFVLSVSGRQIVVDSGVYDYENTQFRRYLRSTRAHNTLMIDGGEQSEIWSAFRAGRLARGEGDPPCTGADGTLTFQGAHRGYDHLAGGPRHARKVEAVHGLRWRIEDTVTGRGPHKLESFVHFHPELQLVEAGTGFDVLWDGRKLVRITPFGQDEVLALQAPYCPQFGVVKPAPCLRLAATRQLPAVFGYEIECAP